MGNWLAGLICGAVMLPACAGAQGTDYHGRQQVEAKVASLFDSQGKANLSDKAAALMADLGLTWHAPVMPRVEAQAFVPDQGAVIEVVDIRLLLTRIALQAGAQDHAALVRAQGARDHGVILLRGGLVTLSDLLALSQGTPAQAFVTMTPQGVVLTRPLAIWDDAGLTLGAADQLILERSSGSFVANLGWLDLSGGSIIGSKATNTAEPSFRPFVLTAGQGSFTAQGATFKALGFGTSKAFGGITVLNSGLVTPAFASGITESQLTDVTTLGLIGTTNAVVSENRFDGSQGTAILISHALGTVVADNSLTSLSGPRAIRVTDAATDVRISANLLSGAARIGIMIDGKSRTVSVDGNLVQGHQTAGISVDAADCVTITGNIVVANGGTGISLTDTDGLLAARNAILFNRGSGVLVRDQTTEALARLTGNVFIANREGLRGATPGQLVLEDNDLEGQMPRVFAGDLSALTVNWLRTRGQDIATYTPAEAAEPCTMQGNG